MIKAGKDGPDSKSPISGGSSGSNFFANYGGAITSGLSSLFSARAESRAQQDRANMSKEEAKLQRSFEVDDLNYTRNRDLEDKKYRQGLLNPYARYSKGA